MSNLRTEMDRGSRAQRLLDEPLMIEVYDTIRAKITATWTTAKDAQQRESLWLELRALERVWGEIRAVAVTGQMAAKQLDSTNG